MTRKGFVYDTVSRGDPGDVSPESSNYANVVDEGDLTDGLFSSGVSGLSSGTTYFFRSFGYDDSSYEYGDELSFTTLERVFGIKGVVSSQGSVVEGAVVRLVDESSGSYVGSSVSDSAGEFFFTNLDEVSFYSVIAEFDGGGGVRFEGFWGVSPFEEE